MYNVLLSKENKNTLLYNYIPNDETSKYFQSCYLCIKDFFIYIYDNPKIMFQIIKNIENSKFNVHFGNFISTNFYEDILNPDNFSNKFLYLIDLLFSDLVNNSSSPPDFIKKFNDSNLYIILECLSLNKNIKNFFHQILSKILEEYYYSDDYNKLLLFDVETINNYIINQEEKFKMVIKNSSSKIKREIAKKQKNQINAAIASMFKTKIFNDNNSSESTLIEYEMEIINHKSKENVNETQLFTSKYLPELTKNDLLKLYQNDINEIFREYIKNQLALFDKNNNDNNLFSNNILLEKIQQLKESEKIFFYYQRNFMTTIDLISKIINEILLQINIMPNCIKYICKILYLKIIFKFSKITKYEVYNCLSEFFFNLLLKNFLLSPGYKAHITNIIVNENFDKNLKTLVQIISKFTTGNFYISYNDPNFTPFNLFFIEKYKSVCNIFEQILFVNLPEYSNLINNNTKLYSYSMLYTVEFLTGILNIIKHNKKKFFDETDTNNEFYIIYNKFYDNKETLKSLKVKNVSSINCYIFFDIVFPDNLRNNFIDIKLRNPSFKVDETENQNNEQESNLNNAQNLLSELLFNLPNLNSIKSKITKINSTKHILKDFIKYYREINEISFKNELKGVIKIPSDWFINSLLNILDNLNPNFTKNEYEKLFLLLKKNIIKSINSYKFEEVIKLREFFNSMIKTKQEYILNQQICQEVLLNLQIKKFIDTELIEVEIKLEYSDIMKYLLITPKEFYANDTPKIFTKHIDMNNKKSKLFFHSRTASTEAYNNSISITAFTILDFTKKFPDLLEVKNNTNNVNIFILEKNLHIEESLYQYFDIIKSKIPTKFQQYQKDYDSILKKMQKIIFEKIYDKIYSENYDEDDYSLYQKTNSLTKFIKASNLELFDFNFDSVLPSVNELFKKIDYEKSPHGKIEIIAQIFETITNIAKFSLGDSYGEKDLIKVCKYMIIKANPGRLWSNMKYLEMFKEIFINNEKSEKYLELLLESMIEIMKMEITDNIEIL